MISVITNFSISKLGKILLQYVVLKSIQQQVAKQTSNQNDSVYFSFISIQQCKCKRQHSYKTHFHTPMNTPDEKGAVGT